LENYIDSLNNFFVNKPYSGEVILVDVWLYRYSIELLQGLQLATMILNYLKLSKNFGAQAAVRAGIKHATGDYITFLPADLQDPLDLIDRSLEIVREKESDIV
jgi:glycosyltransferase involved in cell wall biosynthesis